MTGYSLHIGLNHVDPAAYNGWDGALNGCINDANAMVALAQQAGFTPTRLLDGQATSQAVVGELALLAQRAVAGDLCLVTYSGHGGHVDDASGDDEDGQDETWVLFDRQVLDDELAQMWAQFRPGVRILVLSDSCHSGTVAKSTVAQASRDSLAQVCARTRDVPDVTATRPKHMPYAVQSADNERRRGTYQFVQALAGTRSTAITQASVILISGCQDNQLSYDGDVNGQFTGTLLRVWQSGAFSGDHKAFHSAIVAQMPPDQTPNLYLTGANDLAFLGQRPFTVSPAGPAPSSQGTPPNPVVVPPSARPTLRQGAVGPDVAYLQERLNAHGASLSIDASFGPATTRAVAGFQSAQGLVADGVVGPASWNALETAPVGGTSGGYTPAPAPYTPAPAPAPAPAPYTPAPAPAPAPVTVTTAPRPTVRRGSSGEHVRYLQHRLSQQGYSVSADGSFGPGTESAVRSFQRSFGLFADGVVGPRTWELLG
ncbi:peptidoglycan-binding protein [Antribacter gilvus]|uniref:peptidoglycan-binding protein n=1 Tax=Antribacter gilvus TaxID=2304675 RepID=UPI0013DF9E05|nr:peptidoglycan-binding protein [Antribacter gilvus]